MVRKKIENEEHFYYQVPKSYVMNNYREMHNSISNYFLLVYCVLDRWKTIKNQYRGNTLLLVDSCGIKLASDRKMSYMVEKIILILEYMEENNMISMVKGNYHNVDEEFIIQINENNFSNKKSYVLLDDNYLEYILNSSSLVKKSTLLQVLLYVLSPKIEHKIVNKETGEIIKTYYQVFSESTHHISEKLGISDSTVKKALSILSDVDSKKGKPLIVRQHKGYVQNGRLHRFPSVYTENSDGWEKRIMAEMEYYDKIIKQKREGEE